MNLQQQMQQIGKQAKQASYELAKLTTDQKNQILVNMADSLDTQREQIKQANKKDLDTGKQTGLSTALLDRLLLDDDRIDGMIQGLKHIASLPDPMGELIDEYHKDNGLTINKIRVPIGVIGIIYESRPNVTADVASLCLKTGNAVILRGGKEAFHSNHAILDALLMAAQNSDCPQYAIQLVPGTERDTVKHLVQMNQYVDLAIPRGGEGLIEAVVNMATVPIIKHYKGLCHTYIAEDANQQMALDIAINAKCQRPGVCNAMETLLIHQDIANEFLPKLHKAMEQNQVQCRGDHIAKQIIPTMETATDEDWDTEYLDRILSIKIVDNTEQAINHINQHGSHHSDAIITENEQNANQFLQQVDSATVYVNASTRFTDGAEFGMGAEIGISTDKLHARGPMGLAELMTYKYQVIGNGQIRD